jgi:hypothetical protein
VTPGMSQEKWTGSVIGYVKDVELPETRDRKNSECCSLSRPSIQRFLLLFQSVPSFDAFKKRLWNGPGRSPKTGGWEAQGRWTV